MCDLKKNGLYALLVQTKQFNMSLARTKIKSQYISNFYDNNNTNNNNKNTDNDINKNHTINTIISIKGQFIWLDKFG